MQAQVPLRTFAPGSPWQGCVMQRLKWRSCCCASLPGRSSAASGSLLLGLATATLLRLSLLLALGSHLVCVGRPRVDELRGVRGHGPDEILL